jgi:hypothetical protein
VVVGLVVVAVVVVVTIDELSYSLYLYKTLPSLPPDGLSH